MKHKADKQDGTTIATTPLADVLGPDMLLGMRRTDGWIMHRALVELADVGDGYSRSARALADRLRDVLMAKADTTGPDLRAV